MNHLFGPQFEAALRDRPGQTAIDYGALRVSYGELAAAARDLALRLRARLGAVPPGTAIALQSACPVSNLIGFLAVQHAGLAHVPVNPRLTDEELQRLMRVTEARLLIAESRPPLPEGPAFAALRPADPVAGTPPRFDLPAPPDTTEPGPVPDTAIGLMLSSSGSGGRPKCVRIPRGRYAHHIAVQSRACDVRPEDVFQLVLPLFHGGGLIGVVGTAMAAGATIAALRPGPFVAETVLDHLEASGATLTHWIPTMLFRVTDALQQRPRAFPRLRRIHFGSMPIDPVLMARCRREFAGKLLQTYGSTECGLIGTLSPAEINAGTEASARIIPGQGVHIVGPEGAEIAVGETGELAVDRDLALIHDYAQDPALTASIVRGDLVHSGDLVERLPGGRFRFVARLDSMIVTGGFKVAPTEVEACLAAHPEIEEVAVIGLPDPEFGQTVCAIVGGRQAPTLDALRLWAGRHLSAYKLPRRLIHLPALPRTDNGKLARGALLDLVSAPSDRP